jgi:hypothetical protein
MHIRKALVIGPAIAVTALVLACGSGGGTKVKAGAPAATGEAQATATQAASKAPVGPKGFKIGDGGTVTRDGKDIATVTLADARTAKDYQGKPALVVTVTVKALPDATETYDFNQFDFSARAADGTTLDGAVLDDGPAELHSGDLAPGQIAKGAIIFKLAGASEHGVIITYSPGFNALAFWTVA